MRKYTINGQSLWSYLLEHGYTQSKAKNIYWRMKNKCMSPEQALEYKHPPAEKDQAARRRRASRRFYGWTEEEIAKNLSPEEGREVGRQKQIKKLYHGKSLGEWSRESGISHGCLHWRVNHMGMNINEAIKMGKRQVLSYKGKSAHQIFGKNHSFVRWRVEHGWSIDDAFTVPKDSLWKYKSQEQRGLKEENNGKTNRH